MAATDTPTIRRPHAAGTRTQVIGLVLLALAPITIFTVGAASGAPLGESLPLLVIGAVIGGGAYVVARFGTWAKVLGIVLTVLAALAGVWLAFGLMALSSPADFVPGVMFTLGVVLSLIGGVQAITARRREPVIGPTRGETRARTVAVGLVVVAAVVSVGANLLGRTTVDDAAAATATPVRIDDFDFATRDVEVAGGGGAQLLVSNQDTFVHDLALPEQDLQVLVSPGSEALLDVSGLASGTYTFYCTLHSDTSEPDPDLAGMAGTLVVG